MEPTGAGVRALLDGPRGRRLCAELVREAVLSRPGRRAPWEGLRGQRDLLPRDVADVDLPALSTATDPRTLLEPLADAAVRAQPWQEPDVVDAALQDADLARGLEPVAAAVLASPAAGWWSDPLAPGDQWQVDWLAAPGTGNRRSAGALLAAWHEGAVAEEARARRERPTDPTAPWSGCWWSTPALSGLVSTTPSLPGTDGGPVGLVLQEDVFGADSAVVRAVRTDPSTRTFEVTEPDAWSALATEYPLEVTSSRRHDWYRSTGWDGRWVVPDWQAVARDWDAVHVSVAGYLSTAGRPLPVGASGDARSSGGDLAVAWCG